MQEPIIQVETDLKEELQKWFCGISRYKDHHIETRIHFLAHLNKYRMENYPKEKYITEAIYTHWRRGLSKIPKYIENVIIEYISTHG